MNCPYFIEGGQIHPVQHHPAVPLDDVIWLAGCMEDGHAFVDSIKLLRRKHFPVNYDPHPWVPGKMQLWNYFSTKQLTALFRNYYNVSLHLKSKMTASSFKDKIRKYMQSAS